VGPSAILTHVVKMQFVTLGLIGLVKHDLFVLAREVILAMPCLHAGVGSVLTMPSVPATWHALTTSVRIHARGQTLHVG